MIQLAAGGDFSFSWQERHGQWLLREGSSGQRAVPAHPTPFVIGRALDCQLRLPDSPELSKTTSRWHCHILSGTAGFEVVDGSLAELPETGRRKPSATGTILNGRKVERSALSAGDGLALGPWRFTIQKRPDSSVDIDPVLKRLTEQPSRLIGSGHAGSVQGYARLEELFERLHRIRDAEEGLETVLSFAVSKVRGARVAALLEALPDGATRVRLGWHRESGRSFDLLFSSGLVHALPPDRAVLLVPRIADPSKSQLEQSITSGLVVPLKSQDRPRGFLYMDNRGGGEAFTEEDLYLAHALASVCALQVALERYGFLARVEQNMRQFFGRDVVQMIVEQSRQGRPVGLGVQEREATLLFVDMQGFSAFSRGREPREVSELLNPYYQLCAEAIQRHGGHVDKFLGDGVLGAFGTQPRVDSRELPGRATEPPHAEQAVRAAREILIGWAQRSAARAEAPLPLRVGLDSGRIVVGNLGFAGRMEYSVTGEAVNLASRMEKLAAPNGIALTDSTRRLLDGRFQCRDGGTREVHGFGQVRVWRL